MVPAPGLPGSVAAEPAVPAAALRDDAEEAAFFTEEETLSPSPESMGAEQAVSSTTREQTRAGKRGRMGGEKRVRDCTNFGYSSQVCRLSTKTSPLCPGGAVFQVTKTEHHAAISSSRSTGR